MAAGLADRVWSVKEVLTFQEVPAPWLVPKRGGRPPKEQTAVRKQISARPLYLRPLFPLREGALHAVTG
jgi:hypothetical protein